MDHQSVFRRQLTSSCGEWSKVVTSKVVLVYNMKEYGGIRVYYCLSLVLHGGVYSNANSSHFIARLCMHSMH
jgi:hypothetical protein